MIRWNGSTLAMAVGTAQRRATANVQQQANDQLERLMRCFELKTKTIRCWAKGIEVEGAGRDPNYYFEKRRENCPTGDSRIDGRGERERGM